MTSSTSPASPAPLPGAPTAPSRGGRTHRPAAAALLAAALLLTGCGTERATDIAAPSAAPFPSASASPSHPGASPYVEPGVPADGAPHHGGNNAFRKKLDLSPEERRAGEAAADRIRPALKRLRERGETDPESVRAALLALDHREESVTVPPASHSSDGRTEFTVSLRDGACVSGGVDDEGEWIEVHGPYLEGGCQEPRGGH
ncbi:hypothetical protein [Streptomyces macrosporus]|uniref:Lipoprotein n=1 Tax=Streptomyces macrosporus TaxID=44032 RepID=A0ABP5XQV4_9ACTN